MGGIELATHEAQPLKAGAAAKDKKKSVSQAKVWSFTWNLTLTRVLCPSSAVTFHDCSIHVQPIGCVFLFPCGSTLLITQENVAASRKSDENISQSKKEKTPEHNKEKTSHPAKENTPQFKKERAQQTKKTIMVTKYKHNMPW